MAVEHDTDTTAFGTVSRLRGKVFEKLSLGASLFGILMLAVLLVYVTVDAFNLTSASPEWLLTYFLTLIIPFIGFCLYSADDPDLTRQTVLGLLGGLGAVRLAFYLVETFVRTIPGLTWQIVYLFAVVVPATAVVGFAGSREPVGSVGFGLLGRLIGGTSLGFMLVILFFVFEPRAWFWAYTLGLVPAALVLGYSTRRPKSPISLTVIPLVLTAGVLATRPGRPFTTIGIPTRLDQAVPVSLPGGVSVSVVALYLVVVSAAAAMAFKYVLERRTDRASEASVLAFVLAAAASVAAGQAGVAPEPILEFYAGYPTTWLIYVWTLAVPLSLASGGLTALRTSRRTGIGFGVGVFVLAVVGSQLAAVIDISPKTAILFLLTVLVPTVAYVRQVLDRREGTPGLVLPVVLVAGVLVGAVIVDIWGVARPDIWLDWPFLTNGPSSLPEQAGFYPAIVGSVILITLVALFSFTFGVGTAVFLEEYAPDTGIGGFLTRIIQVNIANLAAVPSVVYGLLGLGLFVNLIGFGLGTAITGALTLTLLILPITVISAQEAIRAVPDSMRNGSYAMGATRWQTTKNVVLPEALPGVLTGTILSLGRAIGETAPLIMIGFPNTIYNPPAGIVETTTAMPMQIYVWSSSVKSEFRYGIMAAGVVTLLVVLLLMNATAIVIRNRSEQET
ncbi:phosphate transport system permease protein [Halovenus aranensis]|uniref:Phosphate transport system permease protein PstA n=1 Tax=Halovenus aranensis TaxID=890420 RepID=A0A1G8YFR8_9EURY|nr:phosphate ABC transporter permease PstA [Halovenus aranensis]SDK01779.1 phosphate transport system permease protein [Halovenus aranensis]